MRRGAARVVLAIGALLASGCTALPPVTVGEGAPGTIELAKGQELIVALPATPSTGYTWMAPLKDGAVLEQVAAPVFTPADTGEGVGRRGTQTLRFRAVASGRMKLRLLYRRPWEQGEFPADVRIFSVRVR